MNTREETFIRDLRIELEAAIIRDLRIELEAATEDYKALLEAVERKQKERDHIANRIGLLKQLLQLEDKKPEGMK